MDIKIGKSRMVTSKEILEEKICNLIKLSLADKHTLDELQWSLTIQKKLLLKLLSPNIP